MKKTVNSLGTFLFERKEKPVEYICDRFLDTKKSKNVVEWQTIEQEEMNWFFEKHLEEKSNDGFEENMFLLLEEYKKKIAKGIFNFFGTEDKVKLFFASIFNMERQGHVPHGFDAALSSNGFVNDLKLMVK